MKNKETFPSVIEEQINSSGITELSKSQEIAVNYVPFLAEINDQTKLLKELEKGNEKDVKKAHRIKLDLGKICGRAELQKRTDKQLILIQGKFIDGLFNVVNGAARLTQNEAKEIETHFEMMEYLRIEKLQTERTNQLGAYHTMSPPNLGEMEKEVFDNFLIGVKIGYEAKKEAELKAEEEKILNEKLDKIEKDRKIIVLPLSRFLLLEQDLRNMSDDEFSDLYQFLKEEENREEKEYERIKRQNERLQKEAEEKEAKLKAEETARKEREGIAESLRKKEIEKERVIQQAKLKAERDENERLKRELQEKEDAESRIKLEQERTFQGELNKSDFDKVSSLKSDLISLKSKYSFKSKKNQEMYNEVGMMIEKSVIHINNAS